MDGCGKVLDGEDACGVMLKGEKMGCLMDGREHDIYVFRNLSACLH
jgi:hypothetical protein